MKPTLLILALAICLSLAGDAPPSVLSSVGRFVIITGAQIERDTVTLKLDTVTGTTWLLYTLKDKGGPVPGWLELADDLASVRRHLDAKAAEAAAFKELTRPASNSITRPWESSYLGTP